MDCSMPTRTRAIEFGGAMRGKMVTTQRDSFGKITTTETVIDNQAAAALLKGIQVTESENHPGWTHRKDGYNGDLGGEFFTRRRFASSFNNEPVFLSGFTEDPFTKQMSQVQYWGPCLPAPTSFLQYPAFAHSNDSTLDKLGSVAIARCSPSNPSADLSVFYNETMKEGIPSMIGATLMKWRNLSARERRRAIGQEYLNYEFGWKPFVNDLKSLSHSIVHAESIRTQYERDSGKLVRRKYGFKPSLTESWTTVRSNVSPWINPSASLLNDTPSVNKGSVILHSKVEKYQWFSGAFTYYVPPVDGSLRTGLARSFINARKVLGLSLTPDVVWNVTPWSWGIDWFTDTSEVLSNWTDWAIDNQVLAYGYLMEHTISTNTYTFVGPTGFNRKDVRPPDVTLVSETKRRRKATPYGFGLTTGAFTARQKAIVAALGISRSR
jgi:hypothetical protein|nr:MAG: hypothetical protein H3RhizoLitter14321_000004 [Leviviridae sp.]